MGPLLSVLQTILTPQNGWSLAFLLRVGLSVGRRAPPSMSVKPWRPPVQFYGGQE